MAHAKVTSDMHVILEEFASILEPKIASTTAEDEQTDI